MKIKQDKKLEKDSNNESSLEPSKELIRLKKKQKLSSVVEVQNRDEIQVADAQIVDKAPRSIDANIFKYFKDITSEEEKTRMEAALHLFQQLQRNKDQEKVGMR